MSTFLVGDAYRNRFFASQYAEGRQGADEITIRENYVADYSTIWGNMGDDRLTTYDMPDNNWWSKVFGGQGDDFITGVNSVLVGSEGDDHFVAVYTDTDLFDWTYIQGGQGDDVIETSEDYIVLRVEADHGDDVVYADQFFVHNGISTYVDYNFTINGNDGIFTFEGGDGSVTFKDWAAGGRTYTPIVWVYDFYKDYTKYAAATGDDFEANVTGIYAYTYADNDNATGNALNQFINTRSGNDTISGGAGNDYLFAGRGNDVVKGDEGIDLMDGSTGDDTIYFGLGNDISKGGRGNDLLKRVDNSDAVSIQSFEFSLVEQGDDTIIGFNVTSDVLFFAESCNATAENVGPNNDTVVTYPGGTITLIECNCAASIDARYQFGKATRFRTRTLGPTAPPTPRPSRSPTTLNPSASPTLSPIPESSDLIQYIGIAGGVGGLLVGAFVLFLVFKPAASSMTQTDGLSTAATSYTKPNDDDVQPTFANYY